MSASHPAPSTHSERLDLRGSAIDALTTDVAAAAGVSARALRLQTLLHLPRLATDDRLIDPESARGEADRQAHRIAADYAAYPELAAPPQRPPISPTDLEVAVADPDTAQTIEEHFHYLRSVRDDARTYCAYFDGMPAALVAVSPLDVEPLASTLRFGLEPTDVAMVSRVFAFDWAPRNTITFLLARVARRVFAGGTRLLLTYLNPNLGFTGASYRAANWGLYAREHGTRYAYLDGYYITDRKLIERFGGSRPELLKRVLSRRIEFSRLPLDPLELYASFASPRLRAEARALAPLELERPQS